jgi:hypothetical protein
MAMLKPPDEEVRSFPIDPSKPWGRLFIWPTESKWVWGHTWIHRPDRRPMLDITGAAPSYNGQHFLVVYNRATREKVLDIEGVYRNFSNFTNVAAWLDDRYLILPATLRQEIVYVCDLESKRQQ